MKRGALQAAMILVALSVPDKAEIIDRVAVTVDNAVIPESEVLRQIRITALLNEVEPDFSAENRRDTADRLVDQMLIRRDMQFSRYTPATSGQAEAMHNALRKRFRSQAEYEAALKKYRLTDGDVRLAFEWQATFLDFVDARFRPSVQIPEREVQAYYNEHVKGKTTPEASESLEDARPKIEEILMQQRVDNAVDRWLGQARTQTRIRYQAEAFK